MRFQILGIAAVASVALIGACTPAEDDPPVFTGTAGTQGGSAGTQGGTAGTEGGGAGTQGGTAGTQGGTAGTQGGSAGTQGGSAGTQGGGAGTGAAGTGTAGTGAAGTQGGGGGAITAVAPTAGCGKDPGQALGTLVRGTIQTMGTKDANCAATLNGQKKCGPWSVEREYYVKLPAGYMNTKAYPLVFEGPGCGGKGNNLYQNPTLDGMVVRVGLSPPPNSVGHGTNQNQGCFDDKEGDDSVDWVFYENLWDKLAQNICFDKNRVFAGGNSSGAWFSNEVGCKYAGDATHPIRGIMPNTGGLPDQPAYKPTCTTKGMSGFWVHGTGDTTNPFTGNIYAINRALTVNGCQPAGVTYQNAQYDPFTIGTGDNGSCRKLRGCPETFPLIVCPLPLNDHGSHDNVVNPGWVSYIKLFQAPPLLTQ
jgi:hypothetical protein